MIDTQKCIYTRVKSCHPIFPSLVLLILYFISLLSQKCLSHLFYYFATFVTILGGGWKNSLYVIQSGFLCYGFPNFRVLLRWKLLKIWHALVTLINTYNNFVSLNGVNYHKLCQHCIFFSELGLWQNSRVFLSNILFSFLNDPIPIL